ncbi:E3 ubiquitin-protein ligase At1g63170 isoform X1 [Populus trichocarpa]|uniref:E3 ubiquitin-protein ligase At1g63170 isoform X1 n=1 Tax=Populus trichocarpa TaxID=3694 RepID=UPI000D188378|nr:E3 ubiquitin-protein ligase At1g63170 isoform X1 [Populus trichocarpa]|eukprot:XP_024440144.1 E3 ubiquitin-protein ligase At1g63170 isoform X1 [Populus trichocarpa]
MYPPNGSLSSPQSGGVDTSPLLTSSVANHLLRIRRPPQLRGAAARLLRLASSRGMMLREPSVRVRENAAEQLEERQSGWGYSKPIVLIDVVRNLAFVIIAVGVLGLSLEEKPKVPLRVWIVGYGLQCLCHVVCVVVEYRKRRNLGFEESGILSSGSGDSLGFGTHRSGNDGEDTSRVPKRVESASTMVSVIWWVIGFYWVTAAGRQDLEENSPQLYWLCVTFLAFDALFVIICAAAACLIGIAVCCCLPCIIGILYAMTDPQEGATAEEIDRLPKYKFCRAEAFEKVDGENPEICGGMMTECDNDTPIERAVSHEDAVSISTSNLECCICLSAYENGSELRELPCNHHFHCMCIDKWLCINATCPLCKFNIVKAGNRSGNEEA